MDLTFRIFGEQELELLKAWFADAELSLRISYPTAQWFDYIRNTPDVYAWMVYEADTPVGYVQLDVKDDNRAAVALAVKPELRGQGYCKRILRELVKRQEVSGVACIEGHIEVDNLPSLRCVAAVGFRQADETPDEDGLLKFVYTR